MSRDALVEDQGHIAEVIRKRLSPLERVVSRRLTEAHATIPAFEVVMKVDMTRVVARRAELKRIDGAAVAPTVNDFVVHAAAVALNDFPGVNSSLEGNERILHSEINIGIAVSDANGGLVVPVVHAADKLTLAELADETRRLANLARGTGRLQPSDVASGTFSVSNLGMVGVHSFTPIINPPQAAILGVGGIENEVLFTGGEIRNRPVTRLTLNSDHRLVYGYEAAQYLARVRDLLQEDSA